MVSHNALPGPRRGLRTRRVSAGAAALVACALFGLFAVSASAAIQAAFECSPSCTVSAGTTVSFTSTTTSSARITNYEWSLDGDRYFGAADDPDEPHGPTATMARRAFPDAGSYTVYLRATNAAGEQSTAERIVTVTPPPQEPVPQPEQTAPSRVRAGVKPARVNGPFDLSALALRELAAAPRTPITAREGELEEEELETALPGVCPVASCSTNLPSFELQADHLLLRKSFERTMPGIDPQIAASSTHLIAMTNNQIDFLSKDGSVLKELVTAGPAAKLVTYSFTPLDFFKGLFPDINAKLPLPQAYKSQDVNQDGKPDLYVDYVFDPRVIFDPHRKRFWLMAIAQNYFADQAYDPDDPTDQKKAWAQLERNRVVVAVSKTQDPRDGWRFYWWDAIPDDGACFGAGELVLGPGDDTDCPDGYDPKGAPGTPYYGWGWVLVDYPQVGVSQQYFVVTLKESAGGLVHVVDAAHLANGTCPAPAPGQPPCGHYLRIARAPNEDGDPTPSDQLTPVLHHDDSEGPAGPFATFLTGKSENTNVGIYQIWGGGASPSVKSWSMNITDIADAVKGVPQPAVPPASGTHPNKVHIGTNRFLKAVMRNGSLYMVRGECTQPDPAQDCFDSIRLLRFPIANWTSPPWETDDQADPQAPSLNRSIGTAGIHYGWPSLDVNKAGSMVVGYQRSGATVFPESRFAVYWNTKQQQPHQDVVLRKGEYPLTGGSGTVGRIDTTGAAVDPFDDESVWLIHAFVKKISKTTGSYRYVVGKVLGALHPDLLPDSITLDANRLRPGARLQIRGRLENQGDGRSRGARIAAYLVPAAQASAVARSLRIGVVSRSRGIPSGRSAGFTIDARIARRIAPGAYRVKVVVRARGGRRQYDRRNDAVTLPAAIAIRR
jgi:PKD repeat protein